MSGQLPSGWAAARLADVSEKIVDGSHIPPAAQTSGLPMLSGRNILDDSIEWSEYRLIDPAAFEVEHRRTKVSAGDVLLTIVGSIGRATVVKAGTPSFTLQRSVAVLRPTALTPRFCMFQLQSPLIQKWLTENARGTAQKGVYLKQLAELPMLVAPLSEQERLVAELDKQLTGLDAAVAALKRVQTNLKRYRASVLKAACEGRLVPTEAELARREGRSYEPADELVKRILQERRAKWEADQLARMTAAGKPPKDDCWKKKYKEPDPPDVSKLPMLPEGWIWTSIDQITTDAQIGLDRGRVYQHMEHVGSAYLKMNNVTTDGKVTTESLAYVETTAGESERYAVAVDDLLFNTRNSVELVGKVGIIKSAPPSAVYNNNLMRIRLVSAAVPAFVCAQMCSDQFHRRMELVKRSTTNVAAVYAKDLFPLPIAVPPLPEQSRIVDEVERAQSVADELESELKHCIDRSARLRQSILKRAFEGKLVPQDPHDEPASVLLERIRAERAAEQVKRTPATTKKARATTGVNA